jgi:purine-binding chemotaxis protein CheW
MAQTRQFVVFALGDVHCALPREDVVEILPLPRLWRPPGLPNPVLGFAQLRGKPVPAIALSRLLGIKREIEAGSASSLDDLYKHLILLRSASGPIALLVDRALDIATVGAGSILPVEEEDTLNGCVGAELLVDGRLIHLLIAGRILFAEEEEKLADLRRDAEERLSDWVAVA